MDIFSQVEVYFNTCPGLATWPYIKTLFSKAARGKPKQWLLPGLACKACGGNFKQTTAALAAIACLHISIMLIDDLLDDDPRGEHLHLGAPAAANLAAIFQTLGIECIVQSNLDSHTKLAIIESLNKMVLHTALGQYLDSMKIIDEMAYWQMIRMKSSPFFGSSLEIGALLGGESLDIAKLFHGLGGLYGEAIQIHDDLNDSLTVPASVDWVRMQPTLPLLFAQIVDHPDREQFLTLSKQIENPDKLAKAQEILIRCGAVSYCFDRIIHVYNEAKIIIMDLPIQNKAILDSLFHDLILPIQDLVNKIDPTHPVPL